MDLVTLRAFFMWCSILNAAALLLTFVVIVSAGDFVYRIHSRWFPISREGFYMAVYCLLAFYKSLFVALNVVPFVALLIVR